MFFSDLNVAIVVASKMSSQEITFFLYSVRAYGHLSALSELKQCALFFVRRPVQFQAREVRSETISCIFG